MDIKQLRQYIANKNPQRQLNEQSTNVSKALDLARKAHDKITDSDADGALEHLTAAHKLLKTDPAYNKTSPQSKHKGSIAWHFDSVLKDLEFELEEPSENLLDIKYQVEDIIDVLRSLA
jgi:hypothetical protein